MYEYVKDFFVRKGYQTVIDKPRGHGIKFETLKGWIIDVIAINELRSEVVAVEVKRSIWPRSILDALAKAEMYKTVCTKTYVAFPKGDLGLADNKTIVRDLKQECRRRGIGLLEVAQSCREILPPVPSPLRISLLRSILIDIEMKSKSFSGFEVEDYSRYFSDDASGVVWHKFWLLSNDVRQRLRQKGFVQTHDARGSDWWYSYTKGKPKNLRYYRFPHFSIVWWGTGIMVEFIVRDGKYLNNLRRKIIQNPAKFTEIIMRLKRRWPCDIKVRERKHIGGYRTTSTIEFYADFEHLESYHADRLMAQILDRERENKVWLWVGHLFELEQEATQSERLVDHIVDFVDSLMELYDYIVLRRTPVPKSK